MGWGGEGCVGGSVEAQAWLYVARTRLEPRRQPRDERDDQGTLGGGTAGGGAGGIASKGRQEFRAEGAKRKIKSRGDAEARRFCAGRQAHFGCDISYRSEEHTSELQSLMRISYAVFCLKKKRK